MAKKKLFLNTFQDLAVTVMLKQTKRISQSNDFETFETDMPVYLEGLLIDEDDTFIYLTEFGELVDTCIAKSEIVAVKLTLFPDPIDVMFDAPEGEYPGHARN